MVMMIWGSLRANERVTDDDHEFWTILVKCFTASTRHEIDSYQSIISDNEYRFL